MLFLKNKFIFSFVIQVAFGLVSSEWVENEKRIIGGTTSNKDEFPYQVSIQLASQATSNGHICGGSLVSAKYVVTAARCVVDIIDNNNWTTANATLYRVQVAEDIDSDDITRTSVSKITVHPDFNLDMYENDVAVLELQTDMSAHGSAIEMATADPGTKTTCIVTGWGINSTNNIEYQNHLLKLNTSLIMQDACSLLHEYMGSTFNVTENMVCAGFGNDVCLGDTGAPLVCGGQLTGLAVWNTCSSGVVAPTVFTRISQYREWIETQINCACAGLPSAVTVTALAIAHFFYTLS